MGESRSKGRRPTRSARALLAVCGALPVCALFAAGTLPALAAEDAPVTVELNKLEPQPKACRAYVVIDNPGEASYAAMKIDTFVFRTDGVIDRRLLIDLAPVRPGKKGVKLFDLDGLACETIGSLLVNGVTECRDAAGPVADCLPRLRFTSRAAVPLTK